MSLQLQNIGLTVNNQIYLDDVNVRFESGAFNVLLGRTLAGKTSLMRVIAGLDKPTQGKVLIHGQDITSLAVQKRNVSMVYQQFINYPHLSVWENIASPLKLAKISASEIENRVSEIAELLHIAPFLQRLPTELSGGQQQRCAMARALVKDAQIILFDEPLVNLDYKLRESLRLELKALFKRRQSIAVYATTEAHEALALGGTTTLLHEGSVLQSGEALTQYYQPSNLAAADLCHEPPMNRLSVEKTAHSLLAGEQVDISSQAHLTNLSDDYYQCAVRPERVSLCSTGVAELVLQAKVDLAEISASETYLHVTLVHPNLNQHSWVVHLRGIHNFHYDSVITLFVALHDLYVFTPQGRSVFNPSMGRQDAAKVAS